MSAFALIPLPPLSAIVSILQTPPPPFVSHCQHFAIRKERLRFHQIFNLNLGAKFKKLNFLYCKSVWTLLMDTFGGHFCSWTIFGGHFLWTLLVNTFCGHFMWTPFVDFFCEPFLWTLLKCPAHRQKKVVVPHHSVPAGGQSQIKDFWTQKNTFYCKNYIVVIVVLKLTPMA